VCSVFRVAILASNYVRHAVARDSFANSVYGAWQPADLEEPAPSIGRTDPTAALAPEDLTENFVDTHQFGELFDIGRMMALPRMGLSRALVYMRSVPMNRRSRSRVLACIVEAIMRADPPLRSTTVGSNPPKNQCNLPER